METRNPFEPKPYMGEIHNWSLNEAGGISGHQYITAFRIKECWVSTSRVVSSRPLGQNACIVETRNSIYLLVGEARK